MLKLPSVPEHWGANIRSKLPKPLLRLLGFRDPGWKPDENWWLRLVSIFLATMAGMLPNLAIVQHAGLFTDRWHVDALVPSFAASCVLIFGSTQAPFSQPRNFLFGHFLSALVGVCITKLFMTNSKNEPYLWLAGALSVAVASIVMDATGTVHPPSGATALLPSVNPGFRQLGWNFLPLILIHFCVYLGVALLCNNIYRRYPFYWWSPPSPKKATSQEPQSDPEKSEGTDNSTHNNTADTSTPMTTSSEKMMVLEIPVGFELSAQEKATLDRIHARLYI